MNHFRFSRRSAQTTLPPNRNARTGRLCSSYDDQIRSLENDASRIQEEVQQVKGKKRYLEEAHCNLRDNFQVAKVNYVTFLIFSLWGGIFT